MCTRHAHYIFSNKKREDVSVFSIFAVGCWRVCPSRQIFLPLHTIIFYIILHSLVKTKSLLRGFGSIGHFLFSMAHVSRLTNESWPRFFANQLASIVFVFYSKCHGRVATTEPSHDRDEIHFFVFVHSTFSLSHSDWKRNNCRSWVINDIHWTWSESNPVAATIIFIHCINIEMLNVHCTVFQR